MSDGSSETISNATINSNDTTAKPVDPCLVPSWIYVFLSLLMASTAFCCVFFIKSILQERNLRNQGYNLYLVFLVISDTCFSTTLLIEGIIILALGCDGMSNISSYGFFVAVFYYLANLNLNAIIAYEVKIMVNNSYNRRRTAPPSSKRVCFQASMCYIWAVWGAIWFRIGELGFHLNKPVNWALISYDEDGNPVPGSDIIPAPLAVAILLVAIFTPILYVVYVGCSIRTKLPRSGRTRALSLYFMRILIVFFLFYIPTMLIGLILSLAAPSDTVQGVASVMGWILASAQALVTVYMASQKDDIKQELANGLSSFFSSFIDVSGRKSQDSNILREENRIDSPGDMLAAIPEGEDTRSNPLTEENPVPRRISKWEAEDRYDSEEPEFY